MPIKTNDPRACYAREKPRGLLSQEIVVVIVCTSVVAAGDIVLLLLGHSLAPRIHFRIDQTDRNEITLSVVNTLTPEQVVQLRAELASIAGVAIQ